MNKKKTWILLLIGTLAIQGIILLFSLLIPFIEEFDVMLLLILNPDAYIPIIDELMILTTDFSYYIFGIIYISWEIAYQSFIRNETQKKKEEIFLTFKILGVIFGVLFGSMYFWADYTLNSIFIILGLIFVIGFWLVGKSFTIVDREILDKYHAIFLYTVLATILTSAISEELIKDIVQRPRPMRGWPDDPYYAWAVNLRGLPDEIVRSSYSYASGHSAALFALLTPMMWMNDNKKTKVLLFFWAALHAFTRVYVAVHFPYCIFMGSLMGFLFGTLVLKLFQNYGKE